MIADLYILPESFENNTHFSKAAIEEKINSFADDFTTFQQYPGENVCHINADVYDVEFYGGMKLVDILYNPSSALKVLDRDAVNSLTTIIVNTAKQTYTTSTTVINDLLPNHTQDQCYGVICFNQSPHIQPEYQVIYDKAGWYTFRRTFLGMYPVSPKFFMDECVKYFPKLYFHERNEQVVDYILNGNSKKIIYHLAALNDHFEKYPKTGKTRKEFLHDFSVECKLDTIATPESVPTHKPNFTFDFTTDDGKVEKVVCEPHMKLCYTDDAPNTNFSNERRIYFHEGKPNIHGGKILVGHIGKHL